MFVLYDSGADLLNEGQSSEALTDLQAASSLAAPRTLIAYTHLLSGSCLAHMVHPQTASRHTGIQSSLIMAIRCRLQSQCIFNFFFFQRRRQMALQCYRKALETDSSCLCALYRSMLIYREMGHTQAEIEALHLLYSVGTTADTDSPGVPSACWNATPLLSYRRRWCPLLQTQSLPTRSSSPQPYSCGANPWLACSMSPLPAVSFTVWPRSVRCMGGDDSDMWPFAQTLHARGCRHMVSVSTGCRKVSNIIWTCWLLCTRRIHLR